ncbi:MAG: hypothetical protein ACXWUG_21545 [Polyangiales bacterium]
MVASRILLVGFVVLGCSSNGSAEAPDSGVSDSSISTVKTDPACEEIAQACHLYDKGVDSGVAHDCHAFHDPKSDPATCKAMRAACFAACGLGGDATAD